MYDDDGNTGPITRGRTQRSGRTIGSVGLQNLGNTCYMNSALQCVRSVEELTKYFLSDMEQEEINYDNPLGKGGDIAIQYARLLKDMYRGNVNSSLSPRSFKTTIGRHASSFSGYGQQDSQEFLGFLLDGLQEDLSRIKKKPYIEKPDSTDEMVGDPAAIKEMADKVWDITKRRDDSVIADLFTGMYKSTLVCPVCAKVSITFDPFNNLTLQLPFENKWSYTVTFVPLGRPPIKIQVELDRQSPLKAVKEFVSKRCHVAVDCLVIAEVWKSKFYKVYDDMRAASEEISSGDDIIVYQLEAPPTNYPPPKTLKITGTMTQPKTERQLSVASRPFDEKIMVSVLHRRPATRQYSTNATEYDYALIPHFIILTPAEACSEDIIRRKVLEQMVGMTTWTDLQNNAHPTVDASDSQPPDTESHLVTGSDASLENGKVTAASVDGEDDVVDISMHSVDDVKSDNKSGDTSHNRPAWLDIHEPLPAGLDQLFQLHAFASHDVIPCGYTSLDSNNKQYTSLSSRTQRLINEKNETPSADQASDTEHITTQESEQIPAANPHATKRMVGDDSDSADESAMPNKSPVVVPIRAKKARRTYSNKTPKKPTFHRQPMSDDESVEDSGTEQLSVEESEEESFSEERVLLDGEFLVVNWSPDAFETLFNGGKNDTLRGHATWMNPPTLVDPELEQRRQLREKRRQKGITLDECLDEFETEEILSEADRWYCPRCKEHQRASKKFELWKTPDILIMHLKRFSSSGMRRDKLDVEVDFPIKGLDLSSRVIAKEDGKDEIYDLIAVDDHWGGLGGGHYTAFAKSFIDGEWYEYNDSTATKQKDTSNIVSAGAYLLFYRRRSPVPLGGPRLRKIVEDYDSSRQAKDKSDAESGEGQRLGEGSSLHGSSSALRGAGAGQADSSITSNNLEGLPAYTEHLEHNDAAPLDTTDVVMNDGIEFEDEAIDVTHSPIVKHGGLGDPNWSWEGIDNLHNRPNYADSDSADGSAHSDAVQNASSATADSIRGRQIDFDNAETDDEFEPALDIPDMDQDDEMNNYSLSMDLAELATERLSRPLYNRGETNHSVREIREPSEPSIDENVAAEIHLEEGDDI